MSSKVEQHFFYRDIVAVLQSHICNMNALIVITVTSYPSEYANSIEATLDQCLFPVVNICIKSTRIVL